MKSGLLHVLATPIGNLEDLSPRAIRVLTEADLVAAEDTRHTRKLLTHLNLRKELLRCDEAKEASVTPFILRKMQDGALIVLVSDAGTPALSDPGSRLVDAALQAGHTVIPIPGPSAISAVLSVCGFRVVPQQFVGFPPRKGGKRSRWMDMLCQYTGASVFFESPYRVHATLKDLANRMPERVIFVGREMTKLHEEYLRGSAFELIQKLPTAKLRGEFTIVVSPPEPPRKTKKYMKRKEEE